MIRGRGVRQFPSRRAPRLPITAPPLSLPSTRLPMENVAPRPVCGADESTNVPPLTSRHSGPRQLAACQASPIIALQGERCRSMAGARQWQSNNNRRAAESNWQFVIFIASTPLHPKRGIISRGESRGKSIRRDCEASVPLPSPSVLESSADFLWLYLPAPSCSLHFTSFFFPLMTLFLATALSLLPRSRPPWRCDILLGLLSIMWRAQPFIKEWAPVIEHGWLEATSLYWISAIPFSAAPASILYWRQE